MLCEHANTVHSLCRTDNHLTSTFPCKCWLVSLSLLMFAGTKDTCVSINTQFISSNKTCRSWLHIKPCVCLYWCSETCLGYYHSTHHSPENKLNIKGSTNHDVSSERQKVTIMDRYFFESPVKVNHWYVIHTKIVKAVKCKDMKKGYWFHFILSQRKFSQTHRQNCLAYGIIRTLFETRWQIKWETAWCIDLRTQYTDKYPCTLNSIV